MALKISSTPEMNVNMPNILKIEKLLNDSAYSELIEFSANFNTRLRVERKLRMPFLDPQTGVAQKHSNLYMKRTQRMPGMRDGQIYSYPSVRWKNKSNSLKLSSRPFFRFRAADNCSNLMGQSSVIPNSVINSNSSSNSQTTNASASASITDNGEASDFQALIDESNSLTGGADTDSKDSSQEVVVPKEWYYDDMNDNEGVSEEQPDSDFDYNINGYKRKKKGPVRKGSRKSKATDSFGGSDETTNIPKKSRSSAGGGGGRSSSSGGTRRSKKGISSRSSKNNNNNNGKNKISEPLDIEPPSFDSVQDDLKLNENSADSFAYRKFLN